MGTLRPPALLPLLLPLLLLQSAQETTGKERASCTSVLPGDYTFEACGAFCKSEKKANHCKYCKCKSCSFCPAESAPQEAKATEDPPEQPIRKKKKRGKRQMEGDESTAAPAAPTSAMQSSADGADEITGAGKRKQCMSGLKGDYQYETCGAFCKEPKAMNHCRFCKCKSCQFCNAPASSPKVKPAGRPVAAAISSSSEPVSLPASVAGGAASFTPVQATADSIVSTQQPRPKKSKLLAAGAGGLLALLLLLCAMAAYSSDTGLLNGLWASKSHVRAEKEPLVDRDDDSFGEEGQLRSSREAVDEAFRSVELLEESLSRNR